MRGEGGRERGIDRLREREREKDGERTSGVETKEILTKVEGEEVWHGQVSVTAAGCAPPGGGAQNGGWEGAGC